MKKYFARVILFVILLALAILVFSCENKRVVSGQSTILEVYYVDKYISRYVCGGIQKGLDNENISFYAPIHQFEVGDTIYFNKKKCK